MSHRAAFAAAVLLTLAPAPPAIAGGTFDTAQEVGLPADKLQLAVECSAHVIIVKGWADEGRATGFDAAAIEAAGRAWVPMVYAGYRQRGDSDDSAETAVEGRATAIETGMASSPAQRTLFSSRAMFCVRHPPA